MTENISTEAVATEAIETEETAPVETAPAFVKFDTDNLDPETDQPVARFFAETKPLYNDLVTLASEYKALSNIDGAVSDFLATTEDQAIIEFAAKIEKLEATLAKAKADLEAKAVEHVSKTIGNGKTPESIKREFQDINAALNDKVNPLRPMFAYMGIVSEEKKAGSENQKRPRSVFVSNGTPDGDDFVTILNNRPSLSGVSAPNTEGKSIRAWASKTNWVDADGKELGARGALPDAVKEAWKAAGSPEA